jgi:hypothetical protein
MAANSSINLVNLDFDTLKNSLKSYLKTQSQFTDYDFDGSNMSVLLDILTYNTHLNAFYLNMVASEMFLDSAQLRNSVISTAKSLNYTPRSTKSSKALIDVVFPQSGLSEFTVPKYTSFTGRNSRGSYTFTTNEALVLYPANGAFSTSNLAIYEGLLTNDSYVMDYTTENQRFILSNDGVDTDSIEVSVFENVGNTATAFAKATSLFGVTANSNVYFVQATEDTRYEITFGDGVFGKKPKDGSTITVTYRVASAEEGNEATDFILNDNLGAINGYGSSISPTITTVESGFGGAAAESIEEIRYRAPRAYQTQDRAITLSDFTNLVTQEYQTIKSVYVYGGEKVVEQPRYGTVYVVPVTFTGNLLSDSEKLDIEEFLRARTSIGITPKVIDPDFLFVNVFTTVRFNPDATTLSANDIESLVKIAIQDYNTTQLTNLNTEFNLSKLETDIDDVDPSIVSNQTELTLRKAFQVEIDKTSYPLIEFRNEITPGTITSSKFASGGRVYQYTDNNPNLNNIKVTFNGEKTVITSSTTSLYLADITNPIGVSYTPAGTIDYAAGKITTSPIVINQLYDSAGLEFTVKPTQSDVKSDLNDVITIDQTRGISVTVRRA